MNYRKYDIEINMNGNNVNIFCKRVNGNYGCFSYEYNSRLFYPVIFNKRCFRFYINANL